jgi:hypothetical protein
MKTPVTFAAGFAPGSALASGEPSRGAGLTCGTFRRGRARRGPRRWIEVEPRAAAGQSSPASPETRTAPGRTQHSKMITPRRAERARVGGRGGWAGQAPCGGARRRRSLAGRARRRRTCSFSLPRWTPGCYALLARGLYHASPGEGARN